jgi:hypothetical protein
MVLTTRRTVASSSQMTARSRRSPVRTPLGYPADRDG